MGNSNEDVANVYKPSSHVRMSALWLVSAMFSPHCSIEQGKSAVVVKAGIFFPPESLSYQCPSLSSLRSPPISPSQW